MPALPFMAAWEDAPFVLQTAVKVSICNVCAWVFYDASTRWKLMMCIEFFVLQLIPEIISRFDLPENIPIVIGGYSLAGLFALWAVYQTDIFRAAAAASPSVWFPGFVDYMRENRIHSDTVYLSLGDRKEKTGNPIMAAVGGKIRQAHELLKDQGINTTLEWNQGNHFRDTDIRMAKAFAWVMAELYGA